MDHGQKEKKHGTGKLTLCNNLITYIGEFDKDYKQGTGKLIVTDEDHKSEIYRYEGEWFCDMKHGYGELRSNAANYKGGWHLDYRNGFGKMEDLTGIYSGEWKDDKKHGNGVIDYGTGMKYQGEWKEGLEIGTGVINISRNSQPLLCLDGVLDVNLEHLKVRPLPPSNLLLTNGKIIRKSNQ